MRTSAAIVTDRLCVCVCACVCASVGRQQEQTRVANRMAHTKDSATQWSPMLTAANERRDEASQSTAPPPMTTALCITTGITITVPSDSDMSLDATSNSSGRACKRSPTRKKKPPANASASHNAGKSLIQSIWDEDEMKKSATLSGQQQCLQLGAATSTLAKFKAAQDVSGCGSNP